jgi:hypothetical protein
LMDWLNSYLDGKGGDDTDKYIYHIANYSVMLQGKKVISTMSPNLKDTHVATLWKQQCLMIMMSRN